MKTIAVIIALTLLAFKVIDVAVPKATPNVKVVVDTLRMITTVHDTTTVISRAADTVRITIKQVGPLKEADVVHLICGREKLSYGDNRDQFGFSQVGMVFCPKGYGDNK